MTDWRAQSPLRAWRKGHGLAQVDAAARLELSLAGYQNLERGANRPSARSFEQIHRVAGRQVVEQLRAWLRARG